jgi:hypothetical protein
MKNFIDFLSMFSRKISLSRIACKFGMPRPSLIDHFSGEGRQDGFLLARKNGRQKQNDSVIDLTLANRSNHND